MLLWSMDIEVSDALARASLNDAERRVLTQLVPRLEAELGGELHAIWLYGSRARGEPPHAESDIDLMLIADGNLTGHWQTAWEIVSELGDAEGVSPVWFSISVHDPDWLRGRREIRSFFIAEVDRDKIVLYGSGIE